MRRRLRLGTMILAAAALAAGCSDDDGGATCGDGVATGSEVCDGADLLGVTCADLGYGGGTLECRSDCSGHVLTGCTAAPECGDGVRDATELCDGTDLGGATCASLGQGFTGGTLACTAGCTLDTAGCTTCGDGRREGEEACDGTDLGGATCASLGQGFTTGELACTSGCALDPGGCLAAFCGNGVIDGQESCDGSDLGGLTCADLGMGWVTGEMTCLESCNGWDTTDCSAIDPLCGNGEIDGTEVCDGSELLGNGCADLGLGFTGGTLACQVGCQGWDVAGCTGLQTVTPLPNGCLNPSYVYPAGGEETHLVAVRVEPSAYPFTVTAIGYVMMHYGVGNLCDATLEHEVAVFVAPTTTPPATPTLLETISVPGRAPGSEERHVHVGLTTPITLQSGDQLYVALRNAGTFPNVICFRTCDDPMVYSIDQTWWSNSGASPYPWATLGSFGITGTVHAFALGHP